MHELLTKTALELSALYRSGEISPVELVAQALEQQERTDQLLNCHYESTPEQALTQAQLSEQRWLAGAPLSAFDGIPTAIKDGLWWRDHAVYRGFAGNAEHPPTPDEDAPSTAAMAAAGMVFTGRATMPDFGMLASGYSSQHGITRNPWNLEKTPGGSSSGTAAALASGVYPVAVGTDIVGSIRLPAAFCALYGFKPSQGRVPYYPPASPALVAGPMTRTVADAAVLMDILVQRDNRDYTALPRTAEAYTEGLQQTSTGVKLGLLTELNMGRPVDPETAAAVENAARLLERAGHTLITLESPFKPEDLDAGARYYSQRVAHEMRNYTDEQQRRSPYMYNWVRESAELTALQLFEAESQLWALRQKVAMMLDDIDYLLCPTVPFTAFAAELPAPDTNSLFEPWSNTFAFNLGEQPGASINCGFTAAGLPIGLQIIGRRFDDVGVLALSAQFETLSEFARQLPVAIEQS
jgi:Asp-tRNA(Asn)/Glu-tRNA(Gln) amidotransferase A subunit family amidase